MDTIKLGKSKINSLGRKLGFIIERGGERGFLTLEEGKEILNISREIGEQLLDISREMALEENNINKYYEGLHEIYDKGFNFGYKTGYSDGFKTRVEKGNGRN